MSIAPRESALGGRVAGSASEASLEQSDPDAVARLRSLDATRWGRGCYSPADAYIPPLPYASDPSRVLERLETLARADVHQADFARVLLYGMAAGAGCADLRNSERRLGVHHLSPILSRQRQALGKLLTLLGQRAMEAGSPPCSGVGGPSFPRDLHSSLLPGSRLHPAYLVLRQVLARTDLYYRVWLALRGEGERLTGDATVESFQGIQLPDYDPTDAHKAHLWYELADVVSVGILQRLMRISLDQIDEALQGAALGTLLEWAVQARLFGEGRCHSRLEALTAQRLTCDAHTRFWQLVTRVMEAIEAGFRRIRPLEDLPIYTLVQAHADLEAHWVLVDPLRSVAPAVVCRTHRQQRLLHAEQWLRARTVARAEGAARARKEAAPSRAWAALASAVESGTKLLEQPETGYEALEEALARLDAAISQGHVAAGMEGEFLHWPGDGEDYRTRRQRAAAPGDRFYYLLGMAERLAYALEAALDGTAPGQDCLTHDEVGIFIEEWVSHFGPRLETIFTGTCPEVQLPGNRRIQEVDRAVHSLVLQARAAGAPPAHWGWLFCGVTDRLREGLRRLGPSHTWVQKLSVVLQQGQIAVAEGLLDRLILPGMESSDLDAFVTVGVHVFHADVRVVRENLLHNRQLDWAEERRWLLLGSSSARRSVAEGERRICLETGVTHYFIGARRHQKAGNQNRVMPNIPAHPAGRTFYLTLDDDYMTGSQTLRRLVPLAERHPEAAFVQLPLYLFGNHLLGISRARYADAAGMVVWGSLTSLGLRDLRLKPERFADRRTLALPFGTCTLFRMTRHRTSLEDTSGMYTDSVCEDFAQGLLAFSLKHLHHPRPPRAFWDDGLLLNEVWIEGDGVELFGRIRQQTRWAEGSTRNAWRIWLPAMAETFRQWFGLSRGLGERPPSLTQIIGGTAMVLGYTLELLGMLLFMVGFPLTSLMAEYSDTLGHSLRFWLSLWFLHLAYSYYLALHCGLSLRTFLDQHFIRLSAAFGVARGIYQSLRTPSMGWSAQKDATVRVPFALELGFLALAALNIGGAIVGAAKGMTIYTLCLISAVAALWQFSFRQSFPVGIEHRARHLPGHPPRPWLAWWAFRREGQRVEAVQDRHRTIPLALPATVILLVLTTVALTARYLELGPRIPELAYQHPIFTSWLLASDLTQVLSVSWLWLLMVCGIRNQPLYHYDALIGSGQPPEAIRADADHARTRAQARRPLGLLLRYLGGWREKEARAGFLSASGAWIGVACLALLLRLPHLEVNGAFMDEAYYIDAGRQLLRDGPSIGIARVMFGSYLYPLLTAGASLLGGLEGSRLLSHFFGVLTAVAIGQVGHRLAGHAVGIVAGICAAVMVQAVYISALATYDGASVAGVAVSLAFLATALWGKPAGRLSEASRLRWLLASGIVMLLAVLAKYVALIFIPGCLVAIAFSSHPSTGRDGRSSRRETASTSPPRPRDPGPQGAERASPTEHKLAGPRVLAWSIPAVGGLGLYALANAPTLRAWWTFTQGYTTLISEDASTKVDIYLRQGWNVLLALALALVGMLWLFRTRGVPVQSATGLDAGRIAALRGLRRWLRAPLVQARWISVFLVAQVAVFVAFHFSTRADINYQKHINYAFPFLLPLTALGMMRAGESLRSWLVARGIGARVGRWLGMASMGALLVFSGLRDINALSGALRWWPDLRPYSVAADTGLQPGMRVLVDDTGMIYYTLERGLQVDSPFFATFGGRQGLDAARAGVQEQGYDVLILTGGITPEGKALHADIVPLIYPAGYRRVFVPPDSAALAGVFVAERVASRFSEASTAGNAWMDAWYKAHTRDDAR